jgi:hypothetical protein
MACWGTSVALPRCTGLFLPVPLGDRWAVIDHLLFIPMWPGTE